MIFVIFSFLISIGFNSPQLAAVKSVQSTFRYLVACREVVHFSFQFPPVCTRISALSQNSAYIHNRKPPFIVVNRFSDFRTPENRLCMHSSISPPANQENYISLAYRRPAVCEILSRPANALKTTGKSISTPASINCVLTTRTAEDSFFNNSSFTLLRVSFR